MKIKVKNMMKRQEEFDFEFTDTVSDFAKKVMERFAYETGVKLIYNGKIFNHLEKMETYMKDIININNIFIVCIEEKEKKLNLIPIPTATATATATATTTATTTTATATATTTAITPLNPELNESRTLLFGFLTFIRSQPTFDYLFTNSPQIIFDMIRHRDFDSLIRQFNQQSETIQEGMDNRRNIHIDIEVNESLYERCQELNEYIQQSERQSEREYFIEPILNETDIENIRTLVNLGYPEAQVKNIYLMVNKNLDAAANILMDT